MQRWPYSCTRALKGGFSQAQHEWYQSHRPAACTGFHQTQNTCHSATSIMSACASHITKMADHCEQGQIIANHDGLLDLLDFNMIKWVSPERFVRDRPWKQKNMQRLYTFPPKKKVRREERRKKTIMLPSLADLLSVQAPSLVDSQSVGANSAKTFSSGSIPKSEPMATPQPLQPKWGLSCLSLGSWSFLPHHVEAVEPHPETAFGWGIQGPIAPCACRRIRIGLSLLGFPEVWPRSHSDTCCSWCQRTRLRLRSKLHSFPESIWK